MSRRAGDRERIRLGRGIPVPKSPRERLADERAVLEVLLEPLGLADLALGHRPGLVLAEDALALASVHCYASVRLGCSSNPYFTIDRLAALTSSSRVTGRECGAECRRSGSV